MKDTVSEYTLLIVESPTIANQLQKVVPDHVCLLSTNGFLWKPLFDSKKGRLNKKAIPNKLEIRNELRREARFAVHIIIATDSDPSGDFIAWTIHKEFPSKSIKRAHISSLSHGSLTHLLKNSVEIDFSILYKRLQNRFKIRQLWSQAYPEVSMQDAGLLAVFGCDLDFSTFIAESGELFISERPVTVTLNSSQIRVSQSSETGWIIPVPLSTFDVIARLKQSSSLKSFSQAQELIQQTFETTHPETGEGLITYPRTETRSFYLDTWKGLQKDWIKKMSLNEFMPQQLQAITNAEEPHDSIRPLHLDIAPQWVESHLPSEIGSVYRIIYSKTLESIKLPETCSSVFTWADKDLKFMTRSKLDNLNFSLRPFLSVAELGHQLCKLGVLRPSGFGRLMDKALNEHKISITDTGEVIPSKALDRNYRLGPKFSIILKKLRTIADDTELSDETIQRILSS